MGKGQSCQQAGYRLLHHDRQNGKETFVANEVCDGFFQPVACFQRDGACGEFKAPQPFNDTRTEGAGCAIKPDLPPFLDTGTMQRPDFGKADGRCQQDARRGRRSLQIRHNDVFS